MTVVTNHRWRVLKAWVELPEKARGWYDHVGEPDRGSPRFFYYRNWWFDTHDFEPVGGSMWSTPSPELAGLGWHAWSTQSAFDAILIKYDDMFDHVIAGHAVW